MRWWHDGQGARGSIPTSLLARSAGRAYRDGMKQDDVTELEIQIAHQARLLEELDEVVRTQADKIERLEAQMRAIARRLQEAAEPVSGSVVLGGQEKPPHY